jgi:hypothetical protein
MRLTNLRDSDLMDQCIANTSFNDSSAKNVHEASILEIFVAL